MMSDVEKPGLVIILVGLPSSGKSTFAQQLRMNFTPQYTKIEIIDTDKIRMEKFGQEFDPNNEPMVIEEKNKQIQKAFHPNSVLILDDMHYYASMRHDIYQWVNQKHGICHIIYIHTDLKTCQAWNSKRGLFIPNSLIEEIAHKFDIPGTKYGWDTPCLIYNPLQDNIKQVLTLYRQIVENELFEYFHPSKSWASNSKKKINEMEIFAQLDQKTREIIHEIIKNKSNNPIIPSIQQIIRAKYPLVEITNSHIAKILSPLRKQFVKWLFDKVSDPSLVDPLAHTDIFAEFRTFLEINL